MSLPRPPGHDPDGGRYQAVRNAEEQYSLWPADRTPPSGWQPDGFVGSRDEVLDHIERVWTDIRPKSLRDRLDGPTRPPPPG
jgi:MbtH protein